MNVKIKIKNVYSQIVSEYPIDLIEHLNTHYPKYWFMPKYKDGTWDGKYHFFKTKNGKFPTGLLEKVKQFLKDNGHSWSITYAMPCPLDGAIVTDDMLNGIKLRDYQMEAIKTALNKDRGVLQLPTGSGKTEIAVGIVKALNLKTLYLVHTKDLLHQTYSRFKKRGLTDLGIIGDNEFDIDGRS